MSLQTTLPFAQQGVPNVWPSQANTSALAYQVLMPFSQATTPALQPRRDWMEDLESRQAYMVACVEQDIAWQVRINRERRGWSQTKLAKLIGTKQSAVARIEDPAYGKHSLATLTKIAEAFDCALLLRLVDYTKFADETEGLSEEALFVRSFGDLNE